MRAFKRFFTYWYRYFIFAVWAETFLHSGNHLRTSDNETDSSQDGKDSDYNRHCKYAENNDTDAAKDVGFSEGRFLFGST